ncbi:MULTISPECIES: hypothetical protein [unclassified Knoellia]|uniref:hypothetical protein n=1 Tax=Knoellia altitudinis TaxID=3404795 RepID=UPI003608B924
MSNRTRSLAAVAATATLCAAIAGSAAQAAPVSSAATTAPSAAGADFVGAQGTYEPINATRFLDTRSGNGAPKGLVGAGGEVSVLIAGRGGVPSGLSAVVLNLTAVTPSTTTYLTAYPSGTTRPSTSNLNVVASTNRANLVTLPVGSDGRVRIYNSAGTTHILADVVGYYQGLATPSTAGRQSQYLNIGPVRYYDSRQGDGAFAPGESVAIDLGSGDPVEDAKLAAVAVNVTVTGATGSGYISTESASTSILNYTKGQSLANMAVVKANPIAGGGLGFNVVNRGPGTVHVIVDLVGIYDSSGDEFLRFRPVAPQRIMDTRSGVGTAKTPLGAGEARLQTAPATVANVDTFTVVANTTAVRPTASTYLTLYPNGFERPESSNLNVSKGAVGANSTFIDLDENLQYRVHNAVGSTPTIVDAFGAFDYAFPEFLAGSAAKADARQSAAHHLEQKRAAITAAVEDARTSR